jgi:hypothetical protein
MTQISVDCAVCQVGIREISLHLSLELSMARSFTTVAGVVASLTIFAAQPLWGQEAAIIVESAPDGLNSDQFRSQGIWLASQAKSKAPGLIGTSSFFNTADSTAGFAVFTPNLPVAGQYEVFVTFSQSANAAGVKYRIMHIDGPTLIEKNQDGQGRSDIRADTWLSLGTFAFEAGSQGFVEISDPTTGERANEIEPNSRVYADAVKFVPVGFSLPADFLNRRPGGGNTGQGSLPNIGTGSVAPRPAPLPGEADTLEPALTAVAPAGVGLRLPNLPSLDGTNSANGPVPSPVSGTVTPPLTSLAPLSASALPAALPSLSEAQPASATTSPGLPSLSDLDPTGNAPPALPTGNLGLAPIGGTSLAPVQEIGSSLSLSAPPPLSSSTSPPPAVQQTPRRVSGPIHEDDGTGMNWLYDYHVALGASRSQGKPVMVFFTARGNRMAARYTSEFFNQPDVQQALDRFISVKLDFPMNTRLAYRLGVFGAGQIVVVNGEDTKVAAITQIPSSPAEFVAALNAIQ